jgi:hypothetical protein
MLVPQITDSFRATGSALQSLNGNKGMSFHTFSLLKDHCVRMLVKNLDRQMSESIVWEEMETLGIYVQGVLQLCSGCSAQEASNVCSLSRHIIVSVLWGLEVMKLHSLTELCSLQV